MTSQSKFSQSLYNYLKVNTATKISNSESYNYNVLSIGNPKGKYYIDKTNIQELHNVINNCINNENIIPSLIQKPDEISPIILDIDFRQPIDVLDRIYNLSLIKTIFDISKDFIKKSLNVNDEFIKMYLFEKKNLVDDKGRRKVYKEFASVNGVPLKVDLSKYWREPEHAYEEDITEFLSDRWGWLVTSWSKEWNVEDHIEDHYDYFVD